MKKIVSLFIAVFLSISSMANIAFADDYRLNPGDVLHISVWGFTELELKETQIRPDGKITFPLAGEVMAAGYTTGDLVNRLTQGLSVYIKEPKVAVNVLKLHTTRVYVLGEVNKPGVVEIEKQHNLLDAIGKAEGYTKDAAKKKIAIIRKDKPGEVVHANLLNLMKKGDMSQNYPLYDGDVVYVGDNGKIDFVKDILPWIGAMYQINDMKNN